MKSGRKQTAFRPSGGGHREWILIDDPQDPEQTALSRTDAGVYQVYWYFGEEPPVLAEEAQYAGQVEIAKADPVILIAPA